MIFAKAMDLISPAGQDPDCVAAAVTDPDCVAAAVRNEIFTYKSSMPLHSKPGFFAGRSP